jgi:hypothetical protein
MLELTLTLKLTPTTALIVSPQRRPPRLPVAAAEAKEHPGYATSIYRPPRQA